MKKVLPILVVVVLVLSGLGAVALSVEKSIAKTKTVENVKAASITFSALPILQEKEGYLAVSFEKASTESKIPGEPVLPIYIKNFQLPARASNIQVQCNAQEFKTMDISGEVIPGAKYNTRCYDRISLDTSLEKNENIYTSTAWYPTGLYKYKVTCGRNNDNCIVNFVNIQVNPVQYSPGNNKLRYVSGDVDITITYKVPTEQTSFGDEYDLVIIAPRRFSGPFGPLKQLVNHKNRLGMKTILKTVEEIYDEYEGRDKPEQIKYFIKDALDEEGLNWGITYVLLVGGLKSYQNATDREDANQGSNDWWIPVRYTNIDFYDEYIPGDPPIEPGCPSDLYYADIYKEGQVFDDWDSNENDVFAEAIADLWGYSEKIDVLDLSPDVYVGRLACRNRIELRVLVSKIINYEKTSPDAKSWFKKMVVIAGKTFGFYGGMPDGEYVCEKSLEYMDDLVEPEKLYVSNNDTGGPRPIPKDIEKAIRRGAGFVDFEGHGNPIKWDTHWADSNGWAGGMLLYDFWKFFNFRKLPVVVVGGCHNGLFNVTLDKTSNATIYPYYWTHGVPAPVCFAWGMCIVPWGGSIAVIAGTGLGIGVSGDPITLSAELEVNFFYQIGQTGATTFGQAHSGAINKYLDQHPSLDATEYHCITIYQPFGDPSLMLGGYGE